MMDPKSLASTGKKQPLTLAQLAANDDILTDALVDHAYYWTTIPKNRSSYRPSRGIKESDITDVIRDNLIHVPNIKLAEEKFLAIDGLRSYYNALRTAVDKENFRQHMRRYMNIYLPDCPWEVNTTNRYTIVTHEAAVIARRFIRRGERIKYLNGIYITISAEEAEEMTKRKKDFSIVVSSRNKSQNLFMGPARFANHDCDANARLAITGPTMIEIFATRDVERGEEITVAYSDDYFGVGNRECLCKTCEDRLENGWRQPKGDGPMKRSIEGVAIQADGYSFRKRRLADDSAASSRAPSVTADIRPRITKSRSKLSKDSSRAFVADSPTPGALLRQKRKRAVDSQISPPETPAAKLMYRGSAPGPGRCESQSLDGDETGMSIASSASVASDLGMTDILTPATTPEDTGGLEEEPQEQTPTSSTIRAEPQGLKVEELDVSMLSSVPLASPLPAEVRLRLEPLRTVESAPSTDLPTTAISDPVPAVHPAAEAAEETIAETPVTPETIGSDRPQQDASEADLLPPARKRRRISLSIPSAPPARVSRTVQQDVSRLTEHSTRQPGDYTLTDRLLFQPHMAWIGCTNCSNHFVQEDAFFTKSTCPRCERHSKLHGFAWPKTEPVDEEDELNRIKDPRTIIRYLSREDEDRSRGRVTGTASRAGSCQRAPSTARRRRKRRRERFEGCGDFVGKRGGRRGCRRSTELPGSEDEESGVGEVGEAGEARAPLGVDVAAEGIRRSGRRRTLTAKAIEL